MKTSHSSNGPKILLVDDEEQILFSTSLMLRSSGFDNVETLSNPAQLLPMLEKEDVTLLVLDLCMPDASGQDLLKEVVSRYPHVPVVVMTALHEVDTAVECMKSGAFDYLTKPVQKDVFLLCIRRAFEVSRLRREVSSLRRSLLEDMLVHEEAFASIITGSRKMRAIFHYIEAIADSSDPVLITGETGVGKELVARAVHLLSGRNGAFVAVNAAGLDDNVFSDTLFGHRKGAYTGADQEREGMLNRAARGSLFLDEIGDMEVRSQVKLLRLLQEGEYLPLGADLPRKSDARLIVATNRDLQQEVLDGSFRKDLYYRLFSSHIHLPPLRERAEDLPLLLDHFIEAAALAAGIKKPSFPPELIRLLSTYSFPGNIRELRGMVFDAVKRHTGGMLSLDTFQAYLSKSQAAIPPMASSGTGMFPTFAHRLPTLKEAEEYLVAEALKRAQGNQGIAAGLLGLTRQALNKRLHKKG